MSSQAACSSLLALALNYAAGSVGVVRMGRAGGMDRARWHPMRYYQSVEVAWQAGEVSLGTRYARDAWSNRHISLGGMAAYDRAYPTDGRVEYGARRGDHGRGV